MTTRSNMKQHAKITGLPEMMRWFNVSMYDCKHCKPQEAQDSAQGGDDFEENEVGQEMTRIKRDVERSFGEAVTTID